MEQESAVRFEKGSVNVRAGEAVEASLEAGPWRP